MNPRYVTKFVVLCLSLSVFAACSDKDSPHDEPTAAGAFSKTGKSLRKENWCSEIETGKDGRLTFDRFVFRLDGEVTITRLEIQSNSTVEPKIAESGTWSLVNDQLIMTGGTETLQFAVAPSRRASDQAQCLNLTTNSVTKKLCVCAD